MAALADLRHPCVRIVEVHLRTLRQGAGKGQRSAVRLEDGRALVSETAYARKAASAGTMQFAPMARESIVAKFRATPT